MKKKAKAIIERGTDGVFSVYMENDGFEYGINGQGNTAEEAVADFEAVYGEMRDYYAEAGKDFTEADFEYEYDVVSCLRYFAQLFTLVGLSRLTGVNKCQLSHYINGTSRPGRRTVEKIQAGISRFAGELAGLRLTAGA